MLVSLSYDYVYKSDISKSLQLPLPDIIRESYDRNGPVCFTGGEHRLCDCCNLKEDPCITYREGKP